MTLNITFAQNLVASSTTGGTLTAAAQTIAGVKTCQDGLLISNIMPSLTGSQNVTQWLKCLSQVQLKNANVGHAVAAYPAGTTVANYGYGGSVYSPQNNRIYFAPAYQGTSTTWHYVDCNS